MRYEVTAYFGTYEADDEDGARELVIDEIVEQPHDVILTVERVDEG